MHQITVIEPKWLSEVAPTFFRVADMNKISKRKAGEKIEPLYDRFAADKDDWVSTFWRAIHFRRLTLLASQQATARRQGLVANIRSRLLALVKHCLFVYIVVQSCIVAGQ
jgi:hypothetical protein